MLYLQQLQIFDGWFYAHDIGGQYFAFVKIEEQELEKAKDVRAY